MGNSLTKRTIGRLVILCLGLLSFSAFSTARSPSTTVNIVNNSSREIRNVYISPVDADDWSGNQLGNATIGAGQSMVVNVACDSQQIKVIGEDADGCFVSKAITCGANSTWTITNEATRDCGGN